MEGAGGCTAEKSQKKKKKEKNWAVRKRNREEEQRRKIAGQGKRARRAVGLTQQEGLFNKHELEPSAISTTTEAYADESRPND